MEPTLRTTMEPTLPVRTWELECHPEASFDSPEDVYVAINRFARPRGYAVVIERSYYDRDGEKRRVLFACDRHSERRSSTPRPGSSRRPNASSRRCGCLMTVNVIRRRRIVEGVAVVRWELEHRGSATTHNHCPTTHPASHPVLRRADRTQAVRDAVVADAEIGVRAAQTVASIRSRNPESAVRSRDIYNERQRSEAEYLNGRSRVEVLLDILRAGPYYVDTRVDDNNRLSHLFFAQVEALEVFKDNSDVILMDCTYKTNVFGLPLLNIIGVTGMNTTIHVAQAFIEGETEQDYDWALGALRRLLAEREIPMPQVIFVDRDLALLNALETVLPLIPVLLCVWHIVKDVESHARQHGFPQELDREKSTQRRPKWKDSAQHRAFCDAFIALTRSRTEEEYSQRHAFLHDLCADEARYIDEVWLDIWKHKIVRCWTNNVVHFGMQSTSRVEGYHAALKRWLCSSTGDLLTVFNRMTHWWEQSLEAHRGAVSDAKVNLLGSLRGRVYERVVRVIHNYALKSCEKQLRQIGSSVCSGIYSRTTGLPCYHQLRRLRSEKRSLEATDFHPHWWIDRNQAPATQPARILEPTTIAERREARRQRRGSGGDRRRGSGPRGTRRDPSAFEVPPVLPTNGILTDSTPPLPSLNASLARTTTYPSQLAPMRFHSTH